LQHQKGEKNKITTNEKKDVTHGGNSFELAAINLELMAHC
jgi:hypothetical protein